MVVLAAAAAAQTAGPLSVSRVSILNENPIKLQIQTSRSVAPQVQLVSGPERLVIDIPDGVPGPALRGIAAGHGDVKAVRVSKFSSAPPVTRIVLDLNAPQWYRVAPNASGLLVTLGSDGANVASAAPTIGWVSVKTSASASSQRPQMLVTKPMPNEIAPKNGVSVQFVNGLMTIHANDTTLSEVLFQIQKTTGAEIAIPSGAEQDRVAADFGPGTPNEVLGELLNGSGLNFVVVGSDGNPKQLRSVILSRSGGGADAPSAFAQPNTPVLVENVPENIPQDNMPGTSVAGEESVPPQQVPNTAGPQN